MFVILCFILFFTEYGEAKSKKEKEKNVTPNIKIGLVVEELPSKMEPCPITLLIESLPCAIK